MRKMISIILRINLFILLMLPFASYGQTGNTLIIQGTVSDELRGETLIGATVVESDSKNRVITAAITDFNGHYVIKIKNPSNKLVFSYVGYVSKTMDIGKATTLDVSLSEDVKAIEEIVVSAEKKHSDGTFAIPQEEVSTAVQKLSTKDLEGIQVNSIDDALQGRIAGFDIVSKSEAKRS